MNIDLQDKILHEVAKQNGILLDKKDPIFAVVTANQVALEVYIKILADTLQEHFSELESRQTKYLADAKEIAEEKMTAALVKSVHSIKEYENKAIENISEKAKIIEDALSKKIFDEKHSFQWLHFAAVSIISLLIGLVAGVILK